MDVNTHGQTFIYGGKHFAPVRQFAPNEDFFSITNKLRLDIGLGIFRDGYCQKAGNGPIFYSPESFYQASSDKSCDIFRCTDNGKLYVPCEYGLQEYLE